MPILTNSHKGQRFRFSFVPAVFFGFFILCSQDAARGFALDDFQDPVPIQFDINASEPATDFNSVLISAEYRLKQGAWQQAAQNAEGVLAKDKENVKAHAILGLIAALGGQRTTAEQELAFLKNKNASGFYPELIVAVLNGQEKKFQEAHEHLASALQKNPDNPIALYYSGSLHLAQNRLDQAEKAFMATLHVSAEFAPALAGLGQVYWLKKQTEKAVAFYQKAIVAEPETLFYRRQLIAILKATGQKEAENKASTEMLYFIPGVKERYVERGLEFLNQGAYEEASAVADTLVGLYKLPGGYYIKAAVALNQGDDKAARKNLEGLLANAPRTAKTHHEAGMCYLALGDLDKAEEQFKLVIAMDPENGRSFVFLPIIEQLRGHRDVALNGLSLMVKQKESPALTHYLRANIYLADGKMLEYQQEMEKGKELLPGIKLKSLNTVPPLEDGAVKIAENLNLMVLLYLNGWFEKTVQKCNFVLKLVPMEPFALWYKGLARMAQKRYQDASSSLKNLTLLAPDLLIAQMTLGQSYALMNDNENALATFKKVTEVEPSYAPAYLAMGDMYYLTKKDAEALQCYRKSIEISPETVQGYQSLALLLVERPESSEEALKMAEKAVEIAPQNPRSLDALGWVYVQRGQTKNGIEKLKTAAKNLPGYPVIMYHLGVGYYNEKEFKKAKVWLQQAVMISRDFRGLTQAKEILEKIN